jgi:hypothetical protein
MSSRLLAYIKIKMRKSPPYVWHLSPVLQTRNNVATHVFSCPEASQHEKSTTCSPNVSQFSVVSQDMICTISKINQLCFKTLPDGFGVQSQKNLPRKNVFRRSPGHL